MEGVVNNGLGVIGFVQTASKADDAFNARMEREAALAAKVCKPIVVSSSLCFLSVSSIDTNFTHL